jgi:intein/homing endonuclease/DNA polymerase III delta prime subunit
MPSKYQGSVFNSLSHNGGSNETTDDILKIIAYCPDGVSDNTTKQPKQRGGAEDILDNDNDDVESELEVEEIDVGTTTDNADLDDLDATNEEIQDETMERMKKNYSYPDPSDPHIQYKLYKKREFYYNKITERPDINKDTPYSVIKDYRDNTCGRAFSLHEHQGMLSNLINPDTPYRGILVFHGLGTGKCVHKDTRVYVNGDYERIEEIWKNLQTTIRPDTTGGEWCVPSNTLYVNAYDDKSGTIVKKRVVNLYREKINSHLRTITLDNGHAVTITDSHKLLKNNGWESMLSVGDYISVPSIMKNCNEISEFQVSADLAYLLGWQISGKFTEGYECGNQYCEIITNKDINVLNNLKRSIESVGEQYKLCLNNPEIKYLNNCDPYLQINSKDYVNFLEKHGYVWGNLSNKKIPSIIMNTTPHNIKIFLRAFFDAESSICESNNRIEISSTSRDIILQLMTLCRTLGIYMSYQTKMNTETSDVQTKKEYYIGYFSGHDMITFQNEICFGMDYKRDVLLKLTNKYNMNAYSNRKYTQDTVEQLQTNINKELIYSKIISIDRIQYNDYVYDLEVEDIHNYIAEGIICHNTCVGVAIAENFKDMVQKYNTKIHILVPGPIIKESWRHHLLFCTGETYLKYQDKYTYVDEQEKNRQQKQALAQALQYYKLMSYRSFYKRVLGEKIVDKKVTESGKTKTTYRKTREGDFERDIAIDRIYNLDNSIIIVDEAHNLTGNAYGAALRKIINNSKNLRVILMSATPMKNLGSDIIELINFLRPPEHPILREKMINSHKNHEMDFKQGGKEYFKKMVKGYISHVRGSDPLTFAKRVDKGVVPKGLTFTNLIRCEMLEFQRTIYDTTVREFDDALDRASEAVANMAFPGLSKDRKSLSGYYGREGLNIIKEQLKVSGPMLNKMIGEKFFDGKEDRDLIYMTNDSKIITGKIFKMPYLKNFSIKFYKALKKLNRLVVGKKGARTAFVYSNLVKVGIEVFQEVLAQNGYLEYQEDPSNYQITNDTICYYCGRPNSAHKQISRARLLNRLTKEIDVLMGGGRVADLYQHGGADKEDEDDEDEEDEDEDDDE